MEMVLPIQLDEGGSVLCGDVGELSDPLVFRDEAVPEKPVAVAMEPE
jgi:hypothetical protein